MSRPRYTAADALLGAFGIFVVLAALWILSPDVREHVTTTFAADPAGQFNTLALQVKSQANTLLRAANEYRSNNAPMVGFGVVAVVLAFLMFKT